MPSAEDVEKMEVSCARSAVTLAAAIDPRGPKIILGQRADALLDRVRRRARLDAPSGQRLACFADSVSDPPPTTLLLRPADQDLLILARSETTFDKALEALRIAHRIGETVALVLVLSSRELGSEDARALTRSRLDEFVLVDVGRERKTDGDADDGEDDAEIATYRVRGSDEPHPERAYLRLLDDVLHHGAPRVDRTGTGTRALFGRQLRFDLSRGEMPLPTTRSCSWRVVVEELLWFLRGSTDVSELRARNVRVWDANSSREFLDARGLSHLPEGDIGAGYGFQWRHFGAEYGTCKDTYRGRGVDQLAAVEALLRDDPYSRRICMTAWNAAALPSVALPPCHGCFVQFFVSGDPQAPRLSCHMYQRSADCYLGLAVNVPSYALLVHLLAARHAMRPGELVISTGDTHLYADHVDQTRELLARSPLPCPRVVVDEAVRHKPWSAVTADDVRLQAYLRRAPLRAPMSV